MYSGKTREDRERLEQAKFLHNRAQWMAFTSIAFHAWTYILTGMNERMNLRGMLLVIGQRSASMMAAFLLALPTWHNFSRKSYFYFYKLIKQVTNNVFKKRKAKRSCGRGFWGVCTPPVEFNKWRPKRNERNSSQDSETLNLYRVKSRKMKARFQNWRNLWIQSWRY